MKHRSTLLALLLVLTSAPVAAQSEATIEDGTWLVGAEVTPGTYRTDGSDGCYWARLSGFGGQVAEVIANDNPTGPAVVQVGSEDAGFQSRGCGAWVLVEESPPAPEAELTEYRDFLVGLLPVIDSLTNWGPNNSKQARRQAGPIAGDLRGFLLSVDPQECYRDVYVATWVLYGTMQHAADGTAKNTGSIFVAPDLEALTLALGETTC